MNRTTQRKLSRALAGGLGLTLALGGVFYLGKVVGSNGANATQAKGERGDTPEAAVLAKNAPTTKPADAFASATVLQTPTSPVAPPSGSSSSSSSSSTTQPSSPSAPLL